jgi:uncharacterized membrane protein YhdT
MDEYAVLMFFAGAIALFVLAGKAIRRRTISAAGVVLFMVGFIFGYTNIQMGVPSDIPNYYQILVIFTPLVFFVLSIVATIATEE